MNREQLPEYIFGFMPVLSRKLLKRRPVANIPRQSMNVLHNIHFNNGEPMKFYGEKMIISKPNMTKLVNGLIEEGLVTRQHSQEDRRIITLHITEKGTELVENHYSDMKAQILESTSVLSDEEMQDLLNSFETIRQIFDKLDEHEREGEGKC